MDGQSREPRGSWPSNRDGVYVGPRLLLTLVAHRSRDGCVHISMYTAYMEYSEVWTHDAELLVCR